jgi:hypothetical protein
MRVCERCRRAFDCAAENTLRLCKTCAIVAAVIAAPHDLPHNHESSAPKFVRTAPTVVASSTSSVSSTISDRGTITWQVPPRRPSG